jgi:tRNA(Arg) A34 adenosine deaminase TadA
MEGEPIWNAAPAMTEIQSSAADEHQRFMRQSIECAGRAQAAGEPPIGACLVRDGELIVKAHNSVVSTLDITAHAEVMVIRQACESLRTLSLAGCTLYCTVEPCPMCMAACFYAGIRKIVCGARLTDMQALTNAELMPAHDAVAENAGMIVVPDVLRDECLALLNSWASQSQLSTRNRS